MEPSKDEVQGGAPGQPSSRPFKVVTASGAKRVGVVASTLQELLHKGRVKLGLSESDAVRAVLETDATEVDDEDYFNFLEPQTALVLLTGDEDYVPPCMRDRIDGLDEPDSAVAGITGDSKLDELIQALRLDISKIVTFSPDELQALLDVEVPLLTSVLDMRHGPGTGPQVRQACQRFLDEHQQAREYMSLLDLIHAQTGSGEEEGAPSKRKRDQQET